MSTVIKIENVSKKYLIHHEQQSLYPTLREKIGSIFSREKGKSIEEFWALKDISFEIKQGDRLGILGRNGAGKSTLLKILSRITHPTSGSISLKGRVASLLEVGTGFHPELTGRENIFLNGSILGMSKKDIQSRFDEIVDFSEVERFLDTPVKRYSSGMRVRLAFAVAAHLEPEILIVDEVLAVGDVQFQKKCIGKMQEAGKENRTLIFVSHNLKTIEDLCSKGILLDEGSLTFSGTQSEAIGHYLQSDNSNNATKDLSSVKRKNELGQHAKVNEIQITSIDGTPKTEFYFAEPLVIKIKLNALRDTKELSAIIGIDDFSGSRIATSMSHECAEYVDMKNGEERYLKLIVEGLHLKPATYFITVGIAQNGRGLDSVEQAISFEIVNKDYGKAKHTNFIKNGPIQIHSPNWTQV